MKMSPYSTWLAVLMMSTTFAATIAVIDPTLKPSFATVTNISRVDYSLSSYDRIILEVDSKPFFYNGVEIRIDKYVSFWNMTDAQIAPTFQLAADDGFTIVPTELTWMEIQPDFSFNATESTYIRGGIYEHQNFASNTSNQIGYAHGDESNKELTYLKFDFTNYTIDQIDAAKVRIYVNGATVGGAPFAANLYGITDNSWSASDLTWLNAPNHDGSDIDGVNGTDYWLTATSPSWDPIIGASYYDFDASDFIINRCPDRIASFILQPQVNNTALSNGATLDGARGRLPPALWISSTQSWDFSYVDKIIGWGAAADIKMEFVWLGSDSTSSTYDLRVPYFVFRHTLVQKVQSDGTVLPVMLKNQSPYGYGIYWYLSDKNDLTLRALEKTALKTMLNHVAVYNKANGNLKTLVGIDIANENSVTHIHGVGNTVWKNPATWAAYVNFTSQAAWVARTEWEYTVNLANGVKESNYPIWTRSNTFTTAEDMGIAYNEMMRPITGTSVDFIGLDPYNSTTGVLYDYGHQKTSVGPSLMNWALGSNLPMVMENGGSYSSAEWLMLATLAGGAFYNVYELMGPDNYGLYIPTSTTKKDFTPVARGSYVAGVISTNKLLKLLSPDLATKRPSSANGTNLVYFNPLNDGVSLTKLNILRFPVTYTPTIGGIGIGIVRSNLALLFATTRNGTFNIGGVSTYGISSVESGSYNSAGSFVSTGSYPYTASGANITIAATQGTLIHVQFAKPFPLS